jgi:hypothetical protein
MTFVVYPGADGRSTWYDDDGISFEHKRGAFMRVEMDWTDSARALSLSLAPGSQLIGPSSRVLDIRVAGGTPTQSVRFTGAPLRVTF